MQSPSLSPEQRLVKAYIDLGSTLFKQRDYEQAIGHFQKALDAGEALTPAQRSKVVFNIGICHKERGNLELALQQFQTAIALTPEFAPAQLEVLRHEYHQHIQARGYDFSHDWFSRNLLIWQEHLCEWMHQPQINALEVGSWEGRSACWLLEQVLTHDTARLTCVDSFKGNLEHQTEYDEAYFNAVEPRFDANIAKTGAAHKVTKLVGDSHEVLRSLPLRAYHLIYIDGSHVASDVLTDAVLAWGLLAPNGMMVFDDYDFGLKEFGTRTAIDAFLVCFSKKYEVVHTSHQVIIRKTVS